MINVQRSGYAGVERLFPAVRRISVRTFWMLFAAEALLLAAALVALIGALPARTPLADSADTQRVRAAVLAQLDGALDDPLIEVVPGTTARASNVRGLALDGTVYYYFFEGRPSFDPLSRGAVGGDDIEVLLRDDSGDATLVIYRLL